MRKYLVVLTLAALVVSAAAFYVAYENRQAVEQDLRQAVEELKQLKIGPELKKFSPPETNGVVVKGLAQARGELAEAAGRVSRIKGSFAGQVSGKGAAIGSIEEAKKILTRLEQQSNSMVRANSEFLVALTNLQSQYELKIGALEQKLSAERKKKGEFSLEFIIGLMSLITAISTLLLAWRKDSREVRELKLEIEKSRASSKENS